MSVTVISIKSGYQQNEANLERWKDVYKKLFHKEVEFTNLVIPRRPPEMAKMRLIIVAGELLSWTKNCPIDGLHKALNNHFRCGIGFENADEYVIHNDRSLMEGSYAVWVKDKLQSDERFAWRSLNDLLATGHKGMTVLERQLFEADVFFQTGKHLDTQSVTTCAGSRGQTHSAIQADWSADRFYLWNSGDGSVSSNRRSRQVWT